jgi:hypothetical protein
MTNPGVAEILGLTLASEIGDIAYRAIRVPYRYYRTAATATPPAHLTRPEATSLSEMGVTAQCQRRPGVVQHKYLLGRGLPPAI